MARRKPRARRGSDASRVSALTSSTATDGESSSSSSPSSSSASSTYSTVTPYSPTTTTTNNNNNHNPAGNCTVLYTATPSDLLTTHLHSLLAKLVQSPSERSVYLFHETMIREGIRKALGMRAARDVQVHGSWAYGVGLPDCDIDLSLSLPISSSSPLILPAVLKRLSGHLPPFKTLPTRTSTSSHLLKFTSSSPSSTSPIRFDLSLHLLHSKSSKTTVVDNNANTNTIRTWLLLLPLLRPLTLLVKLLLRCHDNADVWQGGLSSYTILVLVRSFLLRHPQFNQYHHHPSFLSTTFLHLLTELSNVSLWSALGIASSGELLSKEELLDECRVEGKPDGWMVVVDPFNPSNNLTAGSFNALSIVSNLKFTLRDLVLASRRVGDSTVPLEEILYIPDGMVEFRRALREEFWQYILPLGMGETVPGQNPYDAWGKAAGDDRDDIIPLTDRL